MENKPTPNGSLKDIVNSYLESMGFKPENSTIMKYMDSLDPEATAEKEGRKVKLKQQEPLKEVEVRQAMVYAKKELVQIRQAIQSLMKELKDLPTYQYVKPQVDNLISSTDDLESLILNRFNEKQMKERSPKEWERLQQIRTFLIQQLLKTYKKY